MSEIEIGICIGATGILAVFGLFYLVRSLLSWKQKVQKYFGLVNHLTNRVDSLSSKMHELEKICLENKLFESYKDLDGNGVIDGSSR